MDRLIESLSRVVAESGNYSSNNYLTPLNENGGRDNAHSSVSGYSAGLKGEYNRINHSKNHNIPQSNIYKNDTESIYPRQINDSNLRSDKTEVSSNSILNIFKNLKGFQEPTGPNTLRKSMFDHCSSNNSNNTPSSKPKESVSKHFAQPTQLNRRKTISEIAMKYSTEDIILSRVRGIFMTRYTRESMQQYQMDNLGSDTQTKNKVNGPMERLFRNFDMDATDKDMDATYGDMEAVYRDMETAFSEAIDDCYARFFTNLPVNLLEDAIHLYFQIQAAYWWYEDMWYDNYSHVLPKLSLRVFGQFVADDCPILRHFVSSTEVHDEFLLNWKRYCKTIPLRGVILINKEFTKCVLVKPWNGSRFMFPRGKMDEMEEDSLCAIREAYEELGIDVTKHLNDSIYIEKQVEEQTIKLFLIPGIDEKTPLEPKKRKEISEIRWFNFTSLPNWHANNPVKNRKTKRFDNLKHNNRNINCMSNDCTYDTDKQDTNHCEYEDHRGKNGKIQENFQYTGEKPGSNKFFRVSHFIRNLRGWIEILRKVSLRSKNISGDTLTNLPKNLNPAIIRRLQNADLGGPPLSDLPLFIRIKCDIDEKEDQTTATSKASSQNSKKKSRSHASDSTKDKRTFGTKAGSGWDVEAMFALNEQKFGVKSTFSLDEYTIPLPKVKQKK